MKATFCFLVFSAVLSHAVHAGDLFAYGGSVYASNDVAASRDLIAGRAVSANYYVYTPGYVHAVGPVYANGFFQTQGNVHAGGSLHGGQGLFVGPYAAPAPEALVVVGNGASNESLSSALVVYKDGTITMGKAQGDISMGQFGN